MAKSVKELKAKLAAGGLSQQQAEAIRDKIKNLGGKVSLENFGYAAPPGSPGYNAQAYKAATGSTGQTQNVASLTNQAKPIKNPGSVYNADVAAEDAESMKQVQWQNPNTTNPFGSTSVTFNDDGTVNYDQKLSENQQAILNADESLTMGGRVIAQDMLNSGQYGQKWNPQTADREFQGGFSDDRLRIEQAVYDNLTRDLERDRGRELESAQQTLYNKGIPFSSDPESRYQKELSVINKRYDDRDKQARTQATQIGGNEMAQQFGMQEQLIANQFSQGQAAHNQGMSDLNYFTNFGSGLQVPNFAAYQGPNYDVNDPSQYIYAGKGLKQDNKNYQLSKDALAQDAAIANKQLAMANQPQAPAPPAFP